MESGVIDQHVYSPEFEIRFLEQINAGISVGHIHCENLDLRYFAQLLRNHLKVFLATCDEQQVRSSFRKQPCGSGAHTLRPTSDNHSLISEDHC